MSAMPVHALNAVPSPRPLPSFRGRIGCDARSGHYAVPRRYRLHLSLSCPGALRIAVVHSLLGLSDVCPVTLLPAVPDGPNGEHSALRPLYEASAHRYPGAAVAPVLSAPEPAPVATDHRQFGYWPYIAGGTGVALIGTSIITGLMASSKAQQLKDDCPGKVCAPSLESVRSSARTLGMTTDVLWISGALVLGTGVTLFVLDHGKAEAPADLQAGCFRGGCGLVASGVF